MKPALVSGLLATLALVGGHGPTPQARQQAAAELGEEEDLHAEMIRLMQEIEVELAAIDTHLHDAAAGEVPLDSVDEAGISDLLRSSRAKSEWVVNAIDRIFEIRDHHQGASGGT